MASCGSTDLGLLRDSASGSLSQRGRGPCEWPDSIPASIGVSGECGHVTCPGFPLQAFAVRGGGESRSSCCSQQSEAPGTWNRIPGTTTSLVSAHNLVSPTGGNQHSQTCRSTARGGGLIRFTGGSSRAMGPTTIQPSITIQCCCITVARAALETNECLTLHSLGARCVV